MYELITCLHNVDKMFLDYNEEMKKAILEDIKRFVPHLSPMRKSKQVFFCDVPKTLLFYYNKDTGRVWNSTLAFSERDHTLRTRWEV